MAKAAAKKAKVLPILTGKRKTSVARVRITPGTGNITVNKKPLDEYFGQDTLKLIATQSLELVGARDKYDVFVNVYGGGLSGQAGAINHGVAKALMTEDETLREQLKKAGFLTRDSRMKERKKYGLKKARKASQFSKR